MSHDPFTLDVFGSSALSSGFGLGVTAFGGFAANDDDPDLPPPSPTPALPLPAAKRPAKRRQAREPTSISTTATTAAWPRPGRSGRRQILRPS